MGGFECPILNINGGLNSKRAQLETQSELFRDAHEGDVANKIEYGAEVMLC